MRKPHYNHKRQNNRHNNKPKTPEFSQEKLNTFSDEIVELFKLVQAARYARIKVQEEYNGYRRELINKRMDLESEIIRIKKTYNSRITTLQEEYNSVKSSTNKELADIRAN